MKKKNQNLDLLGKFADAEKDSFSQQFFAPVLKGKAIKIRISDIIVSLTVIQPKNFEGFGVFTAVSCKTAKFIREPSLLEKQQYFRLFPPLHLILCRNLDNQWMGIPAHQADTRFKIEGLVPIQFATEVQMFDTVKVRFDGVHIWFEQVDPRTDLRKSIYLRDQLVKLTDPKTLDLSGLTQEEKDAYLIAYGPALEADVDSKRNKDEDRIKNTLRRAGAQYQSYIERGNTYTVEYFVNGERHRSVVKKDNLSVESAGICLAGGDKNFDLQSLVCVIRRGQNEGRIVPVGLGREYGDPNYYNRNDDDYD